MTDGIKIPVSAQLNTGDAQKAAEQLAQQMQAMGQRIAQANKVQLNPVGPKTIEDLKKVAAQYQALLKVHSDLAKRMTATGQKGAGFFDIDWSKMYSDQGIAAKKAKQAFEYVTGGSFSAPPGAPPPGKQPPRGPGGSGGGSGANMAGQVAQAGLRAMGPAGGVAANSLGTGMSAGFGAGLRGLVAGMAALGVSKLIGAITEKIEQAEGNAVEYDKIKRTLGDVNVSFGGLKAQVTGAADNLRVTYSEAAKLGLQFSKLSNLSGEQYKTLSGELGVGVGMSRAFGLDPSEGTGVMGRMRGIGVTRDVQDSRKFALLIGETIGKAGAFAKADEVMGAIAGFAESQTRQNAGAANVAGYAGSLAAMVGSRIPGFDVGGSAALLSRINGNLSAGGAKGEASQFFTGSIGAEHGLNPYQTRAWREGGSYATLSSTFGPGSAAGRYGMSGPGGNTTFLEATRDKIAKQYGRGWEGADAFANHTGIGINQAMGFLSLKDGQMGQLQQVLASKGIDLSKLNASGIGNLATAQYGNAEQRRAMASEFLGRRGENAISKEHADLLHGAAGNDDALKDALTKIAAQYDQEHTQGSDIRDSKNALDNIKVALADRMVPLTQEIRHGIMFLAGDHGKLSPNEIMAGTLRAESRDRLGQIAGNFDGQISGAFGEANNTRKARAEALEDLKKRRGSMTPEEQAEAQAKITKMSEDLAHQEEFARKRILGLMDEKERLLREENAATEKSVKALGKPPTPAEAATGDAGAGATVTPASYSGGTGVRSGYDPLSNAGTGSGTGSGAGAGRGTMGVIDGPLAEKLAAAEKANGLPAGTLSAVMRQETGGNSAYLNDPAKYHYGLDASGRHVAGHTGKISTAFGPFGILESTGRKPGYGVSPLQDKGMDEQIRFSAEYLAARARSAGGLEAGLSGYGEGSAYGRQVMNRIRRGEGTPMPGGVEGAGSSHAGQQQSFAIGGTFYLRDPSTGKQIASPVSMQPRVMPASAMGNTAGATGGW